MMISDVQKNLKNPSKLPIFKMKSEIWMNLMYPKFLYQTDTYLKNLKIAYFKSKSKNMVN